MNNNPRVLVISNNGFSKTNSNGRTLGSLFQGWPKDKLAQFYISVDNLDYSVCENYFNVTDKEALLSLIFATTKKGDENKYNKAKTLRKSKRTVFQTIARDFVWGLEMWKKKNFKQWLSAFNPEIVVIQSGDFPYLIRLAREISKKFKAKLIFYNTEGYYFFNNNYMDKGCFDRILFPLFQKYYRRVFNKAMHVSSHAVYLNELLKRDYDRIFNVSSTIIYNSSDIEKSSHTFNSSNPKISYLGNLVMGRDDALIEFAEVLYSISPNLRLDIYGNANDQTLSKFKNVSAIDYHGVVGYEEVKQITQESDILIHVESQNAIIKESLRYGFSGKIADCLLSAKPFIIYASRDYACTMYLEKNEIGWVASSKMELREVLESILHNDIKRESVVEKSYQKALINHSLINNRRKFQDIIISLCK